MKLTRLIAVVWVLTAAACAVELPPPGGPPDKTPPSVTQSLPADSSAGVDRGASVSITFSEGMARSKFERQIEFYPPVPVGKVSWKKNTITIRPDEPLHPDTTYLVVVRPGYKDSHGVTNKQGHQFVFATSAALDSGSVSGIVKFRREPTVKGIVRLFVLPKDSTFAPNASKPDRETRTDKNGRYVFHYLPTEGNQVVIWAFHDEAGNGTYEPQKDLGESFPDTLILSPEFPVLGNLDIAIVDPNEPAKAGGLVINQSGIDSLPVTVAAYNLADSALAPAEVTRCDPDGRFQLGKLLIGSYLIKAFIDLRADSLCGNYPCPGDSSRQCQEPCAAYPDTVTVSPGDEIKLKDMILEPPEGEE